MSLSSTDCAPRRDLPGIALRRAGLAGWPPPGFDALAAEAAREAARSLARLQSEMAEIAPVYLGANGALFIAVADDLAVGVGGFTPDIDDAPGLGRVRRLFVARAWRRRGVGRALVERAAEAAAATGATRLVLRARPEAFSFFEALGFRPDAGQARTHSRVLSPEAARPC